MLCHAHMSRNPLRQIGGIPNYKIIASIFIKMWFLFPQPFVKYVHAQFKVNIIDNPKNCTDHFIICTQNH